MFAVQIKSSKPLITKAWPVLLIRTIFGTLAMFGFYYALTNMPLADCIFIGRTQPLILVLLAPVLIKEKTPKVAWLSISLGMIGAGFIIRPALVWSNAAYVALFASAASAVAHLMVRRLGRTDEPPVIVFNFTILLALISGAVCIQHFIWPSLIQWLYLVGIAIFASFGQYLLTTAYTKDSAPAVAAASYSSVILSVVYGYFFWNEIPSLFTLFGGLLIVSSGMLLIILRFHPPEPAGK